jgi:prophage DNA circulation protein
MKQMVFYALAAALVLGAGCKKKDDGTTELMSAEEVAEKTAEATQKAEEVTKKAAAAVSSFSVKAEDVMADLNKSVEEIKKKVATFDKSQVVGYANTYKDVLLEKKDQISSLTQKVKSLSMSDMLGEKGKALKAQLSQYTDQFNALKERYSIYLEKAKAFGIDLSAYGL